MRCLVIGGTGFIGIAACRELMRRGVETVAAGRTARPYGVFTSHVAFDRRDPDQLRAALEKVRPDVVLDLAAYRPAEVSAMVPAIDRVAREHGAPTEFEILTALALRHAADHRADVLVFPEDAERAAALAVTFPGGP